MAGTKKYRNLAHNDKVAFVDDLASIDPWRPRMVEIRGRAERVRLDEPLMPGMTHEVIRIHPERVFVFGARPARRVAQPGGSPDLRRRVT